MNEASRDFLRAVAGQVLAQALAQSPWVVHVPLDTHLPAQTLQSGTRAWLRGADVLYLATAELHESSLISWDLELIHRAAALTTRDWLAANP